MTEFSDAYADACARCVIERAELRAEIERLQGDIVKWRHAGNAWETWNESRAAIQVVINAAKVVANRTAPTGATRTYVEDMNALRGALTAFANTLERAG